MTKKHDHKLESEPAHHGDPNFRWVVGAATIRAASIQIASLFLGEDDGSDTRDDIHSGIQHALKTAFDAAVDTSIEGLIEEASHEWRLPSDELKRQVQLELAARIAVQLIEKHEANRRGPAFATW